MPTPSDRRRLRSRLAIGVGLASLGVTALALAQGAVLHELVPNLGADEGSSLVSSRGAEPAAIVYGGQILRAPTDGPRERDERAMEAASGSRSAQDEGLRSASFHPDRVTALHGAVPYFEVFAPAITPYKRVSSLDAVAVAADGTPYLTVAHTTRQRVPVEGPGAQPPDARARDRFWGSVVLDFSAGPEVPMPSVSPESRLLSFRTEPETAMHVERDGAGNYLAVLDAPGAHEVRAIFLTDAPRSFFGLDRGQRLPDVRADVLASEVTALPTGVARDARAFAAELGLSRESSFGEALRVLVRHFRAFIESDEPPRDTGNVYLDLARGMRGVCRHRAYAFVITASALGISSRFVSNEAHAWVEVHLPDRGGWIRVDLGGSAQGLSPRNTEQAPAYSPRVDDPFPRPPEFERALAEARGVSAGRAGGGQGGAEASGQGDRVGAGAGSAGQRGDGEGGTAAGSAHTAQPHTAQPHAAQGSAGSDALTRPSRGAAQIERIPLEIAIAQASSEVFRGQSIEVSGSAQSARGRASGLRVEVLLRDPSGGERLLGVTVTDAQGNFHGTFGVPPDARVGEYRLLVRSPGDATLLAASAE